MQQKQMEEELENKEMKSKMLYLAEIMQYEDDYDDTNYAAANKKRPRQKSSDSESE